MRNALLIALLVPAVSAAEQRDFPLCGTFAGRRPLEIAKHFFAADRRAAEPSRAVALAPRFEISGDLVLMHDDGTVVAEANPFDLHHRLLQFGPRERGVYNVTSGEAPLDPAQGERFGIGDDQARALQLGFAFPFFGRDYERLFVNSDGNLTFGAGDDASSPRSLERFSSGPPRIALLFADLNPAEGGEVRVLNTPDRLVVTWERVPQFGTENENTVQVELTPDGIIRMRFSDLVASAEGIVGLSPGDSPVKLEIVDLSRTARDVEGAVVERFQRGRTVDNLALSRAFYREFLDQYDWLVVWTNFPSDLDDAFAFASPVSNNVMGIGEDVFDDTEFWGSEGELESFVFMGDLGRYPRDPEGRVFGAASRPTTLGLLAHEVGHRWLARARIFRSSTPTTILLGRQSSHWSFFFDSDGSFLEGNDITQQSDNRFLTGETVSRYSRLDLYLMGLAPAAEVAPFFAVSGASASGPLGPFDNESPPRSGVTISGTRENFTIDDIERAMGARRPSVDASPKVFRQAWVLLTRGDAPASSDEVAKLLDARDAFVAFFNETTLGRGRIETLVRR